MVRNVLFIVTFNMQKSQLVKYAYICMGIAGYLTIRYSHDTWLTIKIISRYSDSAIIDIFLENHIMIHHDICLNKMPVKI